MIYCLTRTTTHIRIHTRATIRDMEEMFPCDDMSLRARVLNIELSVFFKWNRIWPAFMGFEFRK